MLCSTFKNNSVATLRAWWVSVFVSVCFLFSCFVSVSFIIGVCFLPGNFATVWSGLLEDAGNMIEIAIKKLKGLVPYLKSLGNISGLLKNTKVILLLSTATGNRRSRFVESILREAVTMRMLDHPNVLSLLGVSLHGARPCVILPLMKNGNLKDYLENNKSVSVHFYCEISLTDHRCTVSRMFVLLAGLGRTSDLEICS